MLRVLQVITDLGLGGAERMLAKLARRLPSLGIECGDLLIVEPRKKAATGELVLARGGENAFIGRWWAKHGLRELQETGQNIEGELRIAGAVTVIVRQS